MLRICVAVPFFAVCVRLCVVCVLVCVLKPCGGGASEPAALSHCDPLALRCAFVRSGRTPKVSCSLNGTRAKIVNCHQVSGSAQGCLEGKLWKSDLTQAIKDAAITELARRYGGGASEPITLIGGRQPQEERGAASQK